MWVACRDRGYPVTIPINKKKRISKYKQILIFTCGCSPLAIQVERKKLEP